MCLPEGSIELVTAVCPMCKVFKSTAHRCPHKRDVCRNKSNHPRTDVVHLTNAEVQSFNGCGYCKWARTDPPAHKAGLHNTGWPGCCRPPQLHEYDLIQPADWPAVNAVHRVPIPSDIKSLLDKALASAPLQYISYSSSASSRSPTSTSPTSERKKRVLQNSNNVSRTPAVKIPPKPRAGGSPQMRPSSLTIPNGRPSTIVRTGGSPEKPTGLSTSVEAQTPTQTCRRGPADAPVKRIEGFRTTPPASVRKLVDVEFSAAQQAPVRKSSPTALQQNNSPTSPATSDLTPRSMRRRGSITSTTSSSSSLKRVATLSKSLSRETSTNTTPKSEPQSLEAIVKSLTISLDSRSQAGSSDGSKGDTSTITSDGFTDYLSDESEAEMQRQAEQRALVEEHNRMEDEEFRAARQQLAPIGLQPPQAWTTGVPSKA